MSAPTEPPSDIRFSLPGGRAARLLSGPVSAWAVEAFAHHRSRLGPSGLEARRPAELLAEISSSGLVGRGGGEFPLARKLALATAANAEPIVVVNASEGEPASRKDLTLLRTRTHLVLDGAEAVAVALGGREVVVYAHHDRGDLRRLLEAALRERSLHEAGSVRFRIAEAPDRYVSGEASAVVSFLESGIALPRRRALPVAAEGVAGRPTIVSNTETYAHVALITRFGADWFRQAGTRSTPGSTLVTLAGAVEDPGAVVEIIRPTSFASVLSAVGGLVSPPAAVLVGGYSGTWAEGSAIWGTSIDRGALRAAGVPMGCGVIAVLDHGACGLAETGRLLEWMARESAGQCGPCASGLPVVAELVELLVAGRARSSELQRLRQLGVALRGRGDCGHPTGAIELLESALDTFSVEVKHHLRGKQCTPRGTGLPLPEAR